MSEFHLIIGNKNYSSWSLRAWIVMTHLGVKFRETIVRRNRPLLPQRSCAGAAAPRIGNLGLSGHLRIHG
jgi:hypothetical protein